jgi:transposase
MIPISSHFNFYLYSQITDMRKSFDGLCGLVTTAMKRDPLSGDVYVFVNRRRDKMKLLVWDRNGFWLFYKRLEQGTLQLPTPAMNQSVIDISYETLVMILEGIDLSSIKRRRRYQRSTGLQHATTTQENYPF